MDNVTASYTSIIRCRRQSVEEIKHTRNEYMFMTDNLCLLYVCSVSFAYINLPLSPSLPFHLFFRTVPWIASCIPCAPITLQMDFILRYQGKGSILPSVVQIFFGSRIFISMARSIASRVFTVWQRQGKKKSAARSRNKTVFVFVWQRIGNKLVARHVSERPDFSRNYWFQFFFLFCSFRFCFVFHSGSGCSSSFVLPTWRNVLVCCFFLSFALVF